MSFGLQRVAVTTTGSAGSAIGNADSKVIVGWIEDIYFDFHASAPGATMDTKVQYKTRGGDIILLANTATDVLKHPRAKPVDNANAAITNAHSRFWCDDILNVDVVQGDALTDAVVAYIRYSKP